MADLSVSGTLCQLLEAVSGNFVNSLSTTLIGNIVTSVVCSQPTDLNITLCVLLNILYQFYICCSYDEVLRFKRSSAFAMSTAYSDGLPFQSSKCLIHLSGDNCDAEIHTQNCKQRLMSLL